MKSFSKYGTGMLLVLAATLLGEVVRLHLSPTNMVMLYLLAVVFAALWLGQLPAIVTAAFGVLAFDFFFVPPRFSLTVADKEYLVTFLGLFTVGVVISSLVSKTRARADELKEQEAETTVLYHLSRDLASASDNSRIYEAIRQNASKCFSTAAALLILLDSNPSLVSADNGIEFSEDDMEAIRWCMKSLRWAGCGTNNHPKATMLFLPLASMGRCIGVLALSLSSLTDESRLNRIIEGFAIQLKMALDRVELTRQAEQAKLLEARENLERALLNSISHDLRTPLVSVTGVLSSLKDPGCHFDDNVRQELLETACGEAERLNRFVSNLLDMTRIEAGAFRLKRDPCDIQELIGCALASIEMRMGNREIAFRMLSHIPLVQMDLVLMAQVLVNLLDNSLKYSPSGSVIEIFASIEGSWLLLEVADYGPGVPDSELKQIFDKFYRIPVPEGVTGTGLGLSICKGIVEAHSGKINAVNRTGKGFSIQIRLPLSNSEEINHDS